MIHNLMKSRCFQRSPLCCSWKDAFSVTLFTGYEWTVGQTSDKPPFSHKNGQYTLHGRDDMMRVMVLQRLILRLVRLVPYSSPCTPNCLGAPIGGKISRGRGSPGRFWCTLFQAGVTRQSHCTPALLHVSMLEPSFSHWLTIAALAVGPWLRTPENKSVDGTYFKKCCDLLAKNVAHICSGLKVWPVSNFAKKRATTSSNKQQGVQTDATCTSNNVASFCTLLKGIQIPGILPEYST